MVEQNSQASIDLQFPKATNVSINFNDNIEKWADIDFKKKIFVINFNSAPTGYLSGGFSFRMGKSIYYSKENPYLGYMHSLSSWLTLRPSSRLKEELNFTKSTFRKEKGEELVYDYNILRCKTTYQFSKRFFLRSILEYNAYWDELTADILLSYMYNPGTVFFFGYGGLFDTNGEVALRQNQHSFFVKISYLWRL